MRVVLVGWKLVNGQTLHRIEREREKEDCSICCNAPAQTARASP